MRRLASAFVVLPIAAITFAIGACGSSDDAAPVSPDGSDGFDAGPLPDGSKPVDPGPCPMTGMGTLTVTVTGLPAAVSAKVDVQGAATVTASKVLTLSGGLHTVMASPVTSPDPIVRGVYLPTVSMPLLCVKTGTNPSVTVTYAKVPTSNTLWVTQGNADGEVASYPGAALGVTGSTPVSMFELGVPSASEVIFDRGGGVFVSSGGSGEIRHFRANDFSTGGTKTPDITLQSDLFMAGIPGPGPLALDPSGNLWVGLIAQKKVVQIPAGNWSKGNPAPTIVLESDALDELGALAFDKKGNLYVAAQDKILRFDAAHLKASANPAVPDLTLESMTNPPLVNPLTTPSGLAFDATGNLWVAFFAFNIIARLTPAEIALTGDKTGANAITPSIQLSTPFGNLEEIAFDESGGLWFSGSNMNVKRFAANQLGATGTPTPDRIITSTAEGDTKGLSFFPAPASSPLYSALP